MPLPMVHLAIAVQAHALARQPLTPDFVLGSVAPDAIHMRANTNRPDKDRVHLEISGTREEETLRKVQPLFAKTDAFAKGYAAHVLTDFWWVQAIAGPFADRLPPGTTPEERRAWYYRETDQVDFNLYHHTPWRAEVWGLLAAAPAQDFAPYLAAEEIDRWRVRVLDWFEKLKQEPGITPQIITDAVIADFIASTAERMQPYLFAYLRREPPPAR